MAKHYHSYMTDKLHQVAQDQIANTIQADPGLKVCL